MCTYHALVARNACILASRYISTKDSGYYVAYGERTWIRSCNLIFQGRKARLALLAFKSVWKSPVGIQKS